MYINGRLVDPSGASLPKSNNAKLANWPSMGSNACGTRWVHLLFKLHCHCVCLSAPHGLAFVHFYVGGVCVCFFLFHFFFFFGGWWDGGLVKLVQILEHQSFQIHQNWYALY